MLLQKVLIVVLVMDHLVCCDIVLRARMAWKQMFDKLSTDKMERLGLYKPAAAAVEVKNGRTPVKISNNFAKPSNLQTFRELEKSYLHACWRS